MPLGKATVIQGWWAILFSPILLPIALVAGMLSRKKDRSASEVAGYLRNLIEGSSGDWDWDEFESVPIRDPALDQIRIEAGTAGPPTCDLAKLRALLARAEALV